MIPIQFYYVLTVFIGLSYLVNARVSCKILLISVPIVIAILFSTGLDYEHYKYDYETGFFSLDPPFFYTKGGLTAEPFYKVYSGFVRVVSGLSFNWFLFINFYICSFIFFALSPFGKVGKSYMNGLFWLFLLPVIIPTIFYFSPRSSLSFFLSVGGFFLLVNGFRYSAIMIFLLAVSTHSQFLPIVFFMLLVSFTLSGFLRGNSKKAYVFLFLYGLSLIFILKFVLMIMPLLFSVLSFLPSAEVATNKLHYFSSTEEGVRLTSVLSLVVFPFLSFFLYKNRSKVFVKSGIPLDKVDLFVFYLIACVVFGFCINLVFFNVPHLSGRLARFSDYLSLGILLPLTFLCYFSLRVVVLVGCVFILSAPLIYPTVYSIH